MLPEARWRSKLRTNTCVAPGLLHRVRAALRNARLTIFRLQQVCYKVSPEEDPSDEANENVCEREDTAEGSRGVGGVLVVRGILNFRGRCHGSFRHSDRRMLLAAGGVNGHG